MGSVASVAKTNLLIIPIGWLIYADKLYLEEKSTQNNSISQPEDIHSKASNLLTGERKNEWAAESSFNVKEKSVSLPQIAGILIWVRSTAVSANFTPFICHFIFYFFCEQKY